MTTKAAAAEKDRRRDEPHSLVGPLPFLVGMSGGFLFFYAISTFADEIWGAGLVFGIILMLVLMQKFGMNFEFSEARLNKNRKEFNTHILFTAKLASIFFFIAWIFISHFFHVQYLFSLLAIFIGIGVYLAVQFGFYGLFDSALIVVTSFKPSLNYKNFLITVSLPFTDIEIERSIPVPLTPPRFCPADNGAPFLPQM